MCRLLFLDDMGQTPLSQLRQLRAFVPSSPSRSRKRQLARESSSPLFARSDYHRCGPDEDSCYRRWEDRG